MIQYLKGNWSLCYLGYTYYWIHSVLSCVLPCWLTMVMPALPPQPGRQCYLERVTFFWHLRKKPCIHAVCLLFHVLSNNIHLLWLKVTCSMLVLLQDKADSFFHGISSLVHRRVNVKIERSNGCRLTCKWSFDQTFCYHTTPVELSGYVMSNLLLSKVLGSIFSWCSIN